MPGLIDAHVHLSSLDRSLGPELHPYGLVQAPAALLARHHDRPRPRRFGRSLFDLREAIERGLFPGPAAGPLRPDRGRQLPGRRAFPGMYREADGPDEMRKAVREQIRPGADFVKIMSTGALTVPEEDVGPPSCARGDRGDRGRVAAARLPGRLARRGLGRDPARRRGGRRHDRARRDGVRGAGRPGGDGRARDHPRPDPVRLRRRRRPGGALPALDAGASRGLRESSRKTIDRPCARGSRSRWAPTRAARREREGARADGRGGHAGERRHRRRHLAAARACGLEDEIGTIELASAPTSLSSTATRSTTCASSPTAAGSGSCSRTGSGLRARGEPPLTGAPAEPRKGRLAGPHRYSSFRGIDSIHLCV